MRVLKRVLLWLCALACVAGVCAGCALKPSGDSLRLSVGTGDTLVVTLDGVGGLTMRMADSKIYFTDAVGQEGADMMFIDEAEIENLFGQVGDEMREQTIGGHTVQVAYVVLDGTLSTVAVEKVGSTGVCYVSAMSIDVLEALLPHLTVVPDA